MRSLRVAHLYPRDLNVYGDLGNVITLAKRLEWRGYRAEVLPVEPGRSFDFGGIDLVFGGGGQNSGQLACASDLLRHRDELCKMSAAGVPMLLICGSYQLFGREFVDLAGRRVPGLGIFRAGTTASRERMIGNIVIDSPFGQLVGFENHSGRTVLEAGQDALGTVRQGFGNNGGTGDEGAVSGNTIGTYLHGPVLPKNPALADHLLRCALRRRYGIDELEPLDDELAVRAARVAADRPQGRKIVIRPRRRRFHRLAAVIRSL
ncbi:glutamine amidotransferase [Kribbella solani]|uniref:type 1 glutamine amidotransferase n=1 Tax=Kribbella solani TaxID=236067 RepID=UPI0029BC160F|nr:glutamine amidotransferase [Kribbella solani]MDX3002474.1 glutamine amidotransferase [Kribbella solani]